MAGIIVAGWDKQLGGQVYSIPLGGMCTRQKCTIGGSGSSYIYGFVREFYKENMQKDECIEFVKKCKAFRLWLLVFFLNLCFCSCNACYVSWWQLGWCVPNWYYHKGWYWAQGVLCTKRNIDQWRCSSGTHCCGPCLNSFCIVFSFFYI